MFARLLIQKKLTPLKALRYDVLDGSRELVRPLEGKEGG